MAWYKRNNETASALPAAEKRSIPDGVFTKCPECRSALVTVELDRNDRICPHCDHHFALPTAARIASIIDAGTWQEHDQGIEPVDPLEFRDSKRYSERLRSSRRSTGLNDAIRCGSGEMDGIAVEAGFFAFEFMGGSMGSVVGEKITRVFERALERRVPSLIFSASGGARMQEGVLSLMQMAKTSAALGRLREAGLPYISVPLHPTTGGVAASFAMLGDAIVSEPKALIGFAGARVIQNTIRQRLPAGFQRAEFLLEHGFVDVICHRKQLKETLVKLLRYLGPRTLS